MVLLVSGLLGIITFYIIILGVGFWASRKRVDDSEEEMMLAGRKLGFTVGTLTLVATWVGGGYVNGASEVMLTRGLVWAQAPIGYSIALFLGGILFVKPMRDMQAITLMDPFQKKYGDRIGGLLFIPAVFGDFFWVASILSALGSSIVVITDINPVVSVGISACFVAAYTSTGAMYSVTYTDVVQMFFILAGLFLTIPFTTTHPAVDLGKLDDMSWLGSIDDKEIWPWIDTMLLLMLGGIPWQGYFQRVLAIQSTGTAQLLSTLSMVGCMAMAIPACYLGLMARVADWEAVPSFNRTLTSEDTVMILPLVMRHLSPQWVAFFGLGAISAAVMSSADSSVLACSGTFARNIYKNLFRPKASRREVAWVLRITVLVITGLSALMALTLPSIYYLAVLSSDLIYVILFPHLVLIVYYGDKVNSYGCVLSFFTGSLLRILGGEPEFGLPAVIQYPGFDSNTGRQTFPHRTFAMLLVFITHMLGSFIAEYLFRREILAPHLDIFEIFNTKEERRSSAAGGSLLLKERHIKR